MAATLEVVDDGQATGEIVPQKLAKALGEFNLPNEISHLIGWTQDRFEDGARGFFLAGLGLIKLHQMEGKTFSLIVDENFPNLNLRSAKNYMAYTRAMINHPAFQAFQKERGGYSKALTVLRVCSEAEIEAADDSGELLGYTMDQIAKMSTRTIIKALCRAREHEAQAVKRATEKLGAENAELRDQVRELEVQVKSAETPADKAMALIKSANDQVLKGLGLLTKVDRAVMVDSKIVRDALFGLMGLAYRVLQNLETEVALTIPEAAAREGDDA